MKTQKLNVLQVWKQLDDVLAPRLRLTPIDRLAYAHLLRRSRLEGKRRLLFSILGIAPKLNFSHGCVRKSVRRLISLGALRLVARSKAGHLVDVRLPQEVPGGGAGPVRRNATLDHPAGLEDMDFLLTPSRRHLIHARERGRCFYCLRRTSAPMKCLDHVVPQAQYGGNSYRNLVSCCMDCNWAKKDRSAPDFLRSLYRDGRLTKVEFVGCLRALKALAAGKLRPVFRPKEEGGKRRIRG